MPKWTFLSLTDLHYAAPDANYMDDPKELTEWEKVYESNIFDDVYPLLDSVKDRDLSFIAIGGDITSFGRTDGFDRFVDEAVPRLQSLVSNTKAICIVPGNHDVSWGLDPTRKDYFNQKFESFETMVKKTGFSTCLYPDGGLGGPNDLRRLRFVRPVGGPVYRDDGRRVLVLNINSAVRCGELNLKLYEDIKSWPAKAPGVSPGPVSANGGTATFGAEKAKSKDDIAEEFGPLRKHLIRDVAQVTQSQVSLLEAELLNHKASLVSGWCDYLKVALVHHHLVHYPGQQAEHKGYEFMVDSSAVLTLLTKFDFDVVLTGHKHCPYELNHRFGDKEIFIVGGPTVGGSATDGSFRGFRLITFESNQFERKLRINNIEHGFGRQNVARDLRISTPEDEILARGITAKGYSYRDVVSITKITEDGDGHRIVECDHLNVTRDGPRMSSHEIELPSTSGYLDNFQVISDSPDIGVALDVEAPIPRRAQKGSLKIRFRPALDLNQPVNYHYQWNAVNAFALNKLQFERKYDVSGDRLGYKEFTHFNPTDPMERLTVIVQFPKDFVLPQEPTIRIARVDKGRDSREWELDGAATNVLKARRALRYFKTLNIVALRVRAPSTNLSYGIEWCVPDAPLRTGAENVGPIVRYFESPRSTFGLQMYHVLRAVRDTLLPDWEKELDVNLMVFGMTRAPRKLATVAALRSPSFSSSHTSSNEPANESIEELRSDVDPLFYGEGIAGRSFKANRIRIYVAPDELRERWNGRGEPNFYIPLKNSPIHKRLICLPLHVPVQDSTFKNNSNVYLERDPYGVLSIGSESDECPISELLLATNNDAFKSLQHEVNWMAAGSILRRF